MQLVPVNPHSNIKPLTIANHFSPSYIDKTTVEVIEPNPATSLLKPHRKHFIEANTQEINMHHLKNECIVPVFSKDNEITFSHQRFIETVETVARKFFLGEVIEQPEIMVSHIVKGRVPEAIHKPVNQLLESDKTIYYERMAFCFEIPTIYEIVDGNRLNLSIGGVRAYNHENLYSKKNPEKFKIFIGFKNMVCCNMCISTDGLKAEIKALSETDLSNAVLKLFKEYNPALHLHQMSRLKDAYLSEHQFAQLIGKTKLYQYLPVAQKKNLPCFEFTDSHINIVAKSYYQDENFCKNGITGEINLWKVFNLFTGANKCSYIDTFLDRNAHAFNFTQELANALYGKSYYHWFLE